MVPIHTTSSNNQPVSIYFNGFSFYLATIDRLVCVFLEDISLDKSLQLEEKTATARFVSYPSINKIMINTKSAYLPEPLQKTEFYHLQIELGDAHRLRIHTQNLEMELTTDL